MLIKRGFLVQEDSLRQADLRITDGKISQIAPELTPFSEEEVVDASGKYLFPGGVDVHTHFDMPAANCNTVDDFASASYAAITGGTTTVIDFAECVQPDCLAEGLETWHKKADGNSYCDYGFHMTLACWKDGMEEQVRQMMAQGISSFKAYTAYKGVMGVDDTQLYQMMECLQRMGAVLCVHCENGEVLDYLQQKYKKTDAANVAFHPLSRPNLVEKEAISRVLDFAAMTGVTVYLVHVSTNEAVQVIAEAKRRGQNVFAETCPHYLLLDDSLYHLPDFEAAKYVMSPPLRKPQDQQALWEGLANQVIDTVSTDHCSFTFHEQKALGKRGLYPDSKRHSRCGAPRRADADLWHPARTVAGRAVQKACRQSGADFWNVSAEGRSGTGQRCGHSDGGSAASAHHHRRYLGAEKRLYSL